MNTIKSAMKRTAIAIRATAASLLLISLPMTAAAQPWQLQAAVEEVPGTRDLEAGQIDKGIQVLEWYLNAAPVSQKSVVLTNLCMAYTLKREYEIATGFCDRAVARYHHPRVAHNNRGVLRALQGDYKGAINDLRKAGCLRDCPSDLTKPANLPMMVARQNLVRAEEHYATIQRQLKYDRLSQKNER